MDGARDGSLSICGEPALRQRRRLERLCRVDPDHASPLAIIERFHHRLQSLEHADVGL